MSVSPHLRRKDILDHDFITQRRARRIGHSFSDDGSVDEIGFPPSGRRLTSGELKPGAAYDETGERLSRRSQRPM